MQVYKQTQGVDGELKPVLILGKWTEMVISTINLGISILMGGNTKVQRVSLYFLCSDIISFLS